jgi:hypothetical protein
MKEYIKVKSDNNNEFLKVRTYYSKEHKSLILSINHVKISYIDNVKLESFFPSNGVLVRILEMNRDSKKIVETYRPEPERMQNYINRMILQNNLILE